MKNTAIENIHEYKKIRLHFQKKSFSSVRKEARHLVSSFQIYTAEGTYKKKAYLSFFWKYNIFTKNTMNFLSSFIDQ